MFVFTAAENKMRSIQSL